MLSSLVPDLPVLPPLLKLGWPAQVLKMGGKHYLTGPVILARTNMDGEIISMTIDEVYLFVRHEVA